MTEQRVYLIRCVLDSEEDVIRDIVIHPSQNLNVLHTAILNAFGIEGGEMSSFFRSNEDWEQGEEISMMDFDPFSGKNKLEATSVALCFETTADRMLFVYDFLNLWTFYLELIDLKEFEDDKTYPRLVGKSGETPKEAPAKNMEAETDDFEDEFPDEDFEDQDEEDWY